MPLAPFGDGPDAIGAGFAAGFAAIGVWSWIALVLAECGWFSAPWIIGLATPLSAAAAATAWRWRHAGVESSTPRSAVVGVAAVMALTGWLAARPGEYLVDGGDGSVYLSIGRSLAREHALVTPDPLLKLIPAADWGAVLPREVTAPRVFQLFPGGIQVYPGVNAVEPNFFHLLPVWIGIAERLGGARWAYYVSPFFGVIGIAAFWLLARRFSTVLIATAASALLLVNYAQIWFTRFPSTEIMTQAFILSGLYFTVECHRRPHVVPALLGAVGFGLAACVRIDVLMFVTPLVVGLLALVASERRWTPVWTWYAVLLAALTTHALAHAALLSRPYSERILRHVFLGSAVSSTSRIVPPLVLGLGVIALFMARRVRGSAVARQAATLVFFLALAAAAWRIWPQMLGGYLPMLISPFGVVVVVAGAIVWWRDERSPAVMLVVALWLVSALVYGESVRDVATLPMLLRRFVPVILPLSILILGVMIGRLWSAGRVGRIAAVATWGALLSLFLSHSRPLMAMTPMTGLHEAVAQVVAMMPGNAIVVTDRTTPSHFGLSLRSAFGRDVLWVSPTEGTGAVLEHLARAAARPLVIARGPSAPTSGVLTARDLSGFVLSPLAVQTLRMSQIEASVDRLPSAVVDRSAVIELYVAEHRAAAALPLTVEVGAADLSSRLDGFYDAEQMGEASARWTRDQAQLQLPRLQPAARGALILRLAAPRPSTSALPVVHVRLDGRDVGVTPPLGPGFQVVELGLDDRSLARLAAAPSVLSLSSPTFVPAEAGMGADTRRLGAVVDWVRVDAR